MTRRDHEPPPATHRWGWRYHHTGIPTQQRRDGEEYLPQFKMYVSGFPESPYGVEWMRFEADSPISELVRTVPHVAFEVDDIEKALEGKTVLTAPCAPSAGVRAAMIIDNGCPIELIEFARDVCVKPSPIQGLGVFAARPFHAGERIRRVNVVREITADSPIREDLGERVDHCSYPDGKVFLWGFPDRHVNHSCDPNAWELYEGDSSCLVARRDIAAGEEVTVDYNINIADGTAWSCACGAARCRGEVAGDFFRLPGPWQREYRPLLAEWFVRRHRERVAELDRRRPTV